MNWLRSALSKLLKRPPANPAPPESPAERLRAEWTALDKAARHDDALAVIDQAIAFAPDIGEYHYCRAVSLSWLNRWPDVLPAADLALACGYKHAVAHTMRGHALYAADRFAEAEPAYAESLRLRPGDFSTMKFLALSLWKLERFEEAEQLFDDAEAAWPDKPEPLLERGKLLFGAAEYDRAADCFERAADVSPENKDVRFWRGASYCNLGLYDLAIGEVADAMSLGAATASEYHWRGEARARLKQYDDALDDFQKAIQLRPGDANAHDWVGWLLMELGRWDEAEQAYNEAIQLNPTVSYYFENRAKIRDRLGREDLAAADFETCLDLEIERENQRENQRENEREQKTELQATMATPTIDIYSLTQSHFASIPIEQLSLTERFFPTRVSPDVQRALDALAETEFAVNHFFCPKQNNNMVYNFQALYTRDRRNPITASAPLHYEVDIGEDKPVRCLWTGVWLLTHKETRFAVLTTTDQQRRLQVAAPATEVGEATIAAFLTYIENAIARGGCYRGKVLSLEEGDEYHGTVGGIQVHRLRPVKRDDVVLPAGTLDLLDRNVLEFVQARPRLRELGLGTKKGLLFHGPPGTGKTHTIHYLSGALAGTTTIVVTAEQIGRLSEYVALARMYQPSMVVIEDVDLIARERRTLRSGAEETLLNRLLNEMDGLQPDADILFVLTTNAPAALEEALANRPGRIDQGIEFPYPDAEGRAKLVRMYAGRTTVTEEIVNKIAGRKEPLSPAFIKELMRRAAQPAVMRGDSALTVDDVSRALDEMFHVGGLNGKLFGFGGR